MRQIFTHVQEYYYKDLAHEIQNQIDDYYEDGYYLIDIQYFGIEKEEGECHAFLLFEADKNHHQECCYGGEEMDTRCNKAQRCFERSSPCEERGKNSCC